MKAAWDKVLLFAFSICLIVGLLSLSLLKQRMNDQQWFICICALAFGGAGFAAFLPGSIEWQIRPGLKATGAFAVLLLVFWFGRDVKSVRGDIREWQLVPPPLEKGIGPDMTKGSVGPDTSKASVYVFLDDQMVKAFGTPPTWLKLATTSPTEDIRIERQAGIIKLRIDDAEPGSKLFFLVQDEDQWWISPELFVPPPFNMQLELKPEATIRKRLQ